MEPRAQVGPALERRVGTYAVDSGFRQDPISSSGSSGPEPASPFLGFTIKE